MPIAPEEFKRPQTIFETWVFMKSPVHVQPMKLPQFTTLTLPDPVDYPGTIIYVTDGTAGTRFRGSDGVAWLNIA